METDNFFYIGCIPVMAHPEMPTDQSPCIKRDCPHCKQPMWVSEKKRLIENTAAGRAKIYCLECLAIGSMAAGFEPTLMDIGELNIKG